MTSGEIRQSFLDFFKSKRHTIVPSSSLLSSPPNLLLFTNAGVESVQVPSSWAASIAPSNHPRAADAPSGIRRRGGELANDLEDVGLNATYHHRTFRDARQLEFLGDYFKREAIDWAVESVTEAMEIPKTAPLRHGVFAGQNPRRAGVSSIRKRTIFWAAGIHRGRSGQPTLFLEQKGQLLDQWARPARAGCSRSCILILRHERHQSGAGEPGQCGVHRDRRPRVLHPVQREPRRDLFAAAAAARRYRHGLQTDCRASSNARNNSLISPASFQLRNEHLRPIFDRLERMCGKRYGSTLPEEA